MFDDPAAGHRAAQVLAEKGWNDEGDLWVFEGDQGVRHLDARGHSAAIRLLRFAERAITADVDYLRLFDDALRHGALVLAVRVPSEDAADHLAGELRELGGHSFAYGAHFDFVPVLPGVS
jgi:hypothetical protein